MPHLHRYDNDVTRVIDRFETLYPGFKDGALRGRNKSLEASLAFSLDRLSQESRQDLAKLGVFRGGVFADWLPLVTDIAAERWRRVQATLIPELEQAGLLRVKRIPFSRGALMYLRGENEPPPDAYTQKISVEYYRFHHTLAPYLRQQQSPDQRRALETRYRQSYHLLANQLYRLDRRAPHAARALVQRELPNLRRALDLTLAAKDPAAVEFADSVERFLDNFGRWRERDSLLQRVRAIQPPKPQGPVTKNEYLLTSRRGEQLLQQGRLREAEQLFRGLLKRMEQGMAYTGIGAAGYDRALTLARLARSLRDQGRAGEAEKVYHDTLRVLGGLDQEDRLVRRQTGAVHTDLATVLMVQGRYPEARAQYEKGLEIDKELGNTQGAAVSNGQLGTLALRERNYAEARRRYRKALLAFQALGEPRSEAIIHHQLEMVAQRESQRADGSRQQALLTEAEEAYKQSLRLKEQQSDYAGAARSANQLGLVAKDAGRYGDAERWYTHALERFKATGQQRSIAVITNNLANLLIRVYGLQSTQRLVGFAGRDLLAKAEEWARMAVKIREDLGDPSLEIWTTYSILAEIAAARSNQQEARHWRRKERAAYVAFPGHWVRLQKAWGAVVPGIQLALQGNKEADEAVGKLLEQRAQRGWGNLTAALRAVLAGQRDLDQMAEAHGLGNAEYLILSKVLEGT